MRPTMRSWLFTRAERAGFLIGTVEAVDARDALGVADFRFGDDDDLFAITILGEFDMHSGSLFNTDVARESVL